MLLQIIPAAILIYYYIFYFGRLVKHINAVPERISDENDWPPISVIMAVKNEAKNLSSNLNEILKQDYQEFEVIVVNDHSEDKTLELLHSFKDQHLRIFDMKEGKGKKSAVAYGIEKARNEYLLFTDADCRPMSKSWIKGMAHKFKGDKSIVLGHGRFYSRKGFLNMLIRYECLVNATQYLSFALSREAYMGVGRNLAYTNQLYNKSSVFEKHGAILSGDDDLIVNEMSDRNNVAISIEEDTHTISEAKRTWLDYIRQKRRQLQAGNYYRAKDRIRLAFFGLCHLVFNIGTLILLVFYSDMLLILSIFVMKWIVQWYYLRIITKKLKDRALLPYIGLLEFVYYTVISLIGISTWIWKVKKWE